VVITGRNFTGVTDVHFDATGLAATSSFTVISDTRIDCTAPGHAAGTVRVRVTAPTGDSANTAADDYTYVTPTRVEQHHARLAYAGTWYTNWSAPAATGGAFRYGDSTGVSVTLKFTGTYAAWLTKKSPVYGVAGVYLDGVDKGTVDLYDAGEVWQQVVWRTPHDLASGTHSLTIAWTGTTHPAAGAANVGLDAFDIIGTVEQATVPTLPGMMARHEETDYRLVYGAAWYANNSAPSASAAP
jgi:hypothetical protein